MSRLRRPPATLRPTRESAELRAGIVGAGLISEHHLAALADVDSVDLVGIFDADPERARARADQFGCAAYKSLAELVGAGADVIHVLTPPSTHADVAVEALERGCHVLVEKPLADSPPSAQRIADAADAAGRVAAVSHSLLYDPQVMRALSRIRAGALGDVIGVDMFRSSEYPPYQGGLLPPHMRDAGYPWRDMGVHCLYLTQELLGEIEDLTARWLSLGGERNIAFDEWRALVRCERGLAQFQLSWNGRPLENQIVVHGTHGSMRVDLFAMFRSRRSAMPLPKAVERVANAYGEALAPLGQVPVSALKFLRAQIQPYQGVRNLVNDFYTRLAANRPPRVAAADAIVVVEWLEKVGRAAESENAATLSRYELSQKAEFLVTGASGHLGSAVVDRLVAEGRRVRALVRQPPRRPLDGVEYAIGNLGDPDAVGRAVEGTEVVIHAGAAMSGDWSEHLGATVVGTRNVADACLRSGVRQLVHVSSMSVIHWAGIPPGDEVDESAPLEPHPELRGAYTRAKLEAERTVSAAAAGDGLPCVILRPGVIFGGGIPLLGPSVARAVGGWSVILGTGKLAVPLVYVDDVVDAITGAAEERLVSGEVIQIIDDRQLCQERILVLAGANDRRTARIPRRAVELIGRASEYPLAKLGRQSPINAYRLKSALAPVRFRSQNAERLLGWRPRVGVEEGIRRVSS